MEFVGVGIQYVMRSCHVPIRDRAIGTVSGSRSLGRVFSAECSIFVAVTRGVVNGHAGLDIVAEYTVLH